MRRATPAGQLDALQQALRTPRETLRSLGEIARATVSAGRTLRPVAPSSLTGPIGPHRRWSWAQARLTDIKEVRVALGGTVNDIVLTLITNGFRELLESRLPRLFVSLVPRRISEDAIARSEFAGRHAE